MGQGASVTTEGPVAGYGGPGTLLLGTRFSSGGRSQSVSVFVPGSPQRAEGCARELKRLRCPDLLKFVDFVASSGWVVTERVEPLATVRDGLSRGQRLMCLAAVMRALSFLHSAARLSHGAVGEAAVFAVRDAASGVLSFRLGVLDACGAAASSAADVAGAGGLLLALLGDGGGAAPERSVVELARAMQHEDPARRPSASDVLRAPLFAADPLLTVTDFLGAFRGHSGPQKRAFFDHLEATLGRMASRDLREAVVPLLTQTDVFVEPTAAGFWDRLFADGARPHAERLDCGVLVSDFAGHLLPAIVAVLGSPVRARKAAVLLQLPRLAPLLAPALLLDGVLPRVLECLRDSDAALCCAALDAVAVLCETWVRNKDEAGLTAVNNRVLPEMRSLGLDEDATVRRKVVNVMSQLIIGYDRINGVLGIRVIVAAFGDPDPMVVEAALGAVEAMKGLITSNVATAIVLPGLVPLLQHRDAALRSAALDLVTFLARLVAQGKNVKAWPEVLSNSTAASLGLTKRRNLFVGALVEVNVGRMEVTPVPASVDSDDDEDRSSSASEWADSGWRGSSSAGSGLTLARAADTSNWNGSSSMGTGGITLARAERTEMFAGLEIKSIPTAPLSAPLSRRGDQSSSLPPVSPRRAGERVSASPSGNRSPQPARVGVEAPVFQVPTSRHERTPLPVNSADLSPPAPKRLTREDLEEELERGSNASNASPEVVEAAPPPEEEAFATIEPEEEDSDDEDVATDNNARLLDLVIQSQRIRGDIVAGGERQSQAVAAVATKPAEPRLPPPQPAAAPPARSKFLELGESEAVDAEEGSGWGEDFVLPEAGDVH